MPHFPAGKLLWIQDPLPMKHHENKSFFSSSHGVLVHFLGGSFWGNIFQTLQGNMPKKKTTGLRCQAWQKLPRERIPHIPSNGKAQKIIVGSNLCLFGDGICDRSKGAMSIVYYTLIPFGHAFFLSGLPWLSGLVGSLNVSVDEQTYCICIHRGKNLWNHQDVTNNESCHVFVGDS